MGDLIIISNNWKPNNNNDNHPLIYKIKTKNKTKKTKHTSQSPTADIITANITEVEKEQQYTEKNRKKKQQENFITNGTRDIPVYKLTRTLSFFHV